ncbi:MAG: thiamine phosphate synthase [Rhodospirillales bacterium]|nr:thiamine phosphate synthase [Rhodospirillales bacterium]
MAADMEEEYPGCRLYLITPPKFEPRALADDLARALDAGDVGCVQLRLKDTDDDAIRRAAELLLPVARTRRVPFLMNDRPDLAAATGCDGVHVGQEDASYDKARAAVGRDRVVGVTCHDSRHLAIDAAEMGADYVAFGAFFASATKAPKTAADIELLQWWAEVMVVPCAAIGGITVDNCPPLIEAGADFLAVISGVWGYAGGPAAAVKAFNAVIARTPRRV